MFSRLWSHGLILTLDVEFFLITVLDGYIRYRMRFEKSSWLLYASKRNGVIFEFPVVLFFCSFHQKDGGSSSSFSEEEGEKKKQGEGRKKKKSKLKIHLPGIFQKKNKPKDNVPQRPSTLDLRPELQDPQSQLSPCESSPNTFRVQTHRPTDM